MKTLNKGIYLLILFTSMSFWSCEKYLDKTQKAEISEEDVFTIFDNFQGYVETMYDDIVDPIHLLASFGEFNNGDDIIPNRKRGWIEGDYMYVIGSGNSKYYQTAASRINARSWTTPTRRKGIWQNSWFGIRAANTVLAHLDDLVEATAEQKKFIEGQAYFFRGYFHWELMKAWGNIPYVDVVLNPDDEMKIPQMGLYITAEKIIQDLQKAGDLLPVDWDQTETGKATLGYNTGRANKGMALANMAECLLFCGSPLFKGVETGNYAYDPEYCKRAADAAWKVIEIANTGRYSLVTWANYKTNFMRKGGLFPTTSEILFSPQENGDARWFTSTFTFAHIGTDAWYSAPTQNYVENFEMAGGLPIDDPTSGYNPNDPWVGRDPRFKYNILVDRDRQITSLQDDRAFVQFYTGGRERTAITSVTGFGWKKYWDETINKYDNGWSSYYYNVPKIRLAEVYLIYAEAANEGYNGPNGKSPNAGLTAVKAVDIVRERAGMPVVNSKFLTNKETFRPRIWNERAVELAYESKRWEDLRRWHVAHLPKYKELYELQFDKDHTYFNKVLYQTINFTEAHYWLPFPVNQISLYPEFKQNNGW